MQEYEIAFSGQIATGAELNQVKAAIARLFKADEALLARLFSGRRVIIKQAVDADTANTYQMAFQPAGAVLEVRALHEIVEEITPSLPEEMHSTEAAETSPGESQRPMLHVAPRDEYMAAFSDVQAPDFGVAPLGEDSLPNRVETPAPELDLSALSLAPAGSDLGQLARNNDVIVPDVSHIKLVDE